MHIPNLSSISNDMVKIVQEAQVEETPTIRKDDIIEMILPIQVKGSRIILEDNFPKVINMFMPIYIEQKKVVLDEKAIEKVEI